jgi:ATP-dependent protease Clp ATPase subunit
MYRLRDVSTQTKICWGKYKNILFIAGGAFDGIEELFLKLNRQAVGYNFKKCG